MTQHPYAALESEYEHLLSIMTVTRRVPVEEGCHCIVERGLDVYRALGEATRVPALLLAALDLREGDCNPHLAIGQGDRWDAVSTHVPRGQGPFPSWQAANEFYVAYDRLAVLSVPEWTWPYACWKTEKWNGFGPRAHGRHSGYLWSCTSVYDDATDGEPGGGKYVADGIWNPQAMDRQPGVVPVMLMLDAEYPDLAFAPLPNASIARPLEPAPAALSPPLGVGVHPSIDGDQTEELQRCLIRLGYDLGPAGADGSYGRRTFAAVREFERLHGLDADGGYAGPQVWGTLAKAMAAA